MKQVKATNLKIGISSCLLGNKVRYDGEHQYNGQIVDMLSQEFELIPFCPEMEIGLGVPRDKIQLVERNHQIVCLDELSHTINYTEKLSNCCDEQLTWLNGIQGYIFKTKSPSCGLTKVKTDHQGLIRPDGQGIFAKRLLQLLPDLPTIEEDQFQDSIMQKEFLTAVVNYRSLEQ